MGVRQTLEGGLGPRATLVGLKDEEHCGALGAAEAATEPGGVARVCCWELCCWGAACNCECWGAAWLVGAGRLEAAAVAGTGWTAEGRGETDGPATTIWLH